MKKLIFSFCMLLSAYSAAAPSPPYQDGDIIFHESQSEQSKAIREVTQSRWSHVGVLFQEQGRWYVAEAIGPFSMTPLFSFINRGKNKDYRIYRLPRMTDAQRAQLRFQTFKFTGKNYDLYFEWSDDLIYCSEFVYKLFYSVLNIEIGSVQKFRDINLEGPYAKELIRKRTSDGHTIDLNEPIVTPASQISDQDLILVEKTDLTP